MTKGLDKGAYYHELFVRDNPELVNHMRKNRVKGTFVRQGYDPETEPDFYNMDLTTKKERKPATSVMEPSHGKNDNSAKGRKASLIDKLSSASCVCDEDADLTNEHDASERSTTLIDKLSSIYGGNNDDEKPNSEHRKTRRWSTSTQTFQLLTMMKAQPLILMLQWIVFFIKQRAQRGCV